MSERYAVRVKYWCDGELDSSYEQFCDSLPILLALAVDRQGRPLGVLARAVTEIERDAPDEDLCGRAVGDAEASFIRAAAAVVAAWEEHDKKLDAMIAAGKSP